MGEFKISSEEGSDRRKEGVRIMEMMKKPAYRTIKKTIRDHQQSVQNTFDGGIGIMCPNCYRVENIYVSAYSNLEATFTNGVIDVSFMIKDHKCPDCKKYVSLVPIDINLVDVVRILNMKGFRTTYSKEPNEKEKGIIRFKYISDELEELLTTLPDSWEIDMRAFKKDIFEIISVESDYEKAIYDINNWAKQL